METRVWEQVLEEGVECTALAKVLSGWMYEIKVNVTSQKDSELFQHFGGPSGKEPRGQYRRYGRCRFNPWVGKMPWRSIWHSSILARRIPWTEEPGRLTVHGVTKRHDRATEHMQGGKLHAHH